MALAVCDYVAEILGGSGSGFSGEGRWLSEMTALGGFFRGTSRCFSGSQDW
jgi:hypothetical protein